MGCDSLTIGWRVGRARCSLTWLGEADKAPEASDKAQSRLLDAREAAEVGVACARRRIDTCQSEYALWPGGRRPAGVRCRTRSHAPAVAIADSAARLLCAAVRGGLRARASKVVLVNVE